MKAESAPRTQALLERWSRGHASAMLVTLCVCWRARAAWPCALCAAISLFVLLAASRGAHTPSGRFGLANAITCLRAALILALTARADALGSKLVAALVGTIMGLDLLDGRLARSRGDASAFGAHFDMETDALLVLVLAVRLWLGEDYGVWVLAAGLWRYVYVLSLWLLPGNNREAPRSLLARYTFVILIAGLVVGLLNHGALGLAGVSFGTLVVSASFVRSYYFSHVAS